MDRPLVPAYNMGNSQIGHGRRAQLYKQQSVTSDDSVRFTSFSRSRPATATSMTRASSCGAIKKRISSADAVAAKGKLTKQERICDKEDNQNNIKNSPPRQISADSGIEPDFENNVYELPARITSYEESEAFLLDQPNNQQFISHLNRLIAPLKTMLQKIPKDTLSQDDLLALVPKIKILIQDLLISYPKSSSGVGKSPRYHDMLKVAVENAAMVFLHEDMWPLIQEIHRDLDKNMYRELAMLWRRGFTVQQFGVDEEWSVPLLPALVELAAVDMR